MYKVILKSNHYEVTTVQAVQAESGRTLACTDGHSQAQTSNRLNDSYMYIKLSGGRQNSSPNFVHSSVTIHFITLNINCHLCPPVVNENVCISGS